MFNWRRATDGIVRMRGEFSNFKPAAPFLSYYLFHFPVITDYNDLE